MRLLTFSGRTAKEILRDLISRHTDSGRALFCKGYMIVYAVLFIIPVSLFFIAVGLLCGSVINSKQEGGICGALLTNLTAWLSGVCFDLDLVGGAFRKTANCLPFIHVVELERAVLNRHYTAISLTYTGSSVMRRPPQLQLSCSS